MTTMPDRPRIAVFRPPDERLETAIEILEDLGARTLADPLVEPVPTGTNPRRDAAVTILTSSTAADILRDAAWDGSETTVVAIGPKTADALRAVGIPVDAVPETYSSAGLVSHLASRVDGARVEVARSDHGSDALIDGLTEAGAYVHETVLYRLERPTDAGASVTAALDGDLEGLAFTSSLTVEHFLGIGAERGRREELLAAADDLVVGAIGDPTAATAREAGLSVDVVPEEATFEALARAIVEAIE